MHQPHIIPFHDGERLVQRRAGTEGTAKDLIRAVTDSLPPTPIFNTWLTSINALWLSTVTPNSNPFESQVWISPVFGRSPELARAHSTRLLRLELQNLPQTDILHQTLAPAFQSNTSVPVALLVIDMEVRRRYRTTGRALLPAPIRSNAMSPPSKTVSLHLRVAEAFPNCPKYIQRRVIDTSTLQYPPTPFKVEYELDTKLSPEDKTVISAADTFFFGTYNPSTGLDANNRGGRPGFVRITSDNDIFWPDYRGNGMFQSSGNLQVNKNAAVSVFDFKTGHLLQLSGTAEVQWNRTQNPNIEAAAERIVNFQVRHVRRSKGPVTNYRWSFVEYSPYNPTVLGEDGQVLEESTGTFPMPVTLARISKETRYITTFRFLAPKYLQFLPGQYATFEFDNLPGIDKSSQPLVRTWTLSEVANSINKGDVTLEVSIKRKPGGLMSNWLHYDARLGLKAKLLGIDGQLSPFQGKRIPKNLLFISAGVGITPNMAILRGIGARAIGALCDHPDVFFFHQERDYDCVPFKKELLRRSAASRGRVKTYFIVSGEGGRAEIPLDAGSSTVMAGRIGTDMLRKNVCDLPERTVYLCGPPGFMEKIRIILLDLGVAPMNIRTEEFDF